MCKILVAALLAGTSIVGVAHAQGVTVEHAWARATAPSQVVGGVFLTLTDTGAADQLVGVTSPISDSIQLHETIEDNGVMKMRPVPALALEPGHSLELKPGSYHLMAMGLKQQLKQGDTFPITLTFAHAAPVTTTVTVAQAGASGPAMMDHGAMMHHDMSGMDHGGMSMPKQ